MRNLKKLALQHFNFIDQNSNFGLELEVIFPTVGLYNKFTKEFNDTISEKEAVLESDISISEHIRSWEIKLPPSTIFEIQSHPVWKLLQKYKAYTDNSCGVHISIPIQYFNSKQWEAIKNAWNDKLQNCENSTNLTGRIPNYFCAPTLSHSKESSIHFDSYRAEFRSMAGAVDFETVRQYIYNIIVVINNTLNNLNLPYIKVNRNKFDIKTDRMKKLLLNLSDKLKSYLNQLLESETLPKINFSYNDLDKDFLLETSTELSEIKFAYTRLLGAIRDQNRETAINELNLIIENLDKAVKNIEYIDKGEFSEYKNGGEFITANNKFKFLRKL